MFYAELNLCCDEYIFSIEISLYYIINLSWTHSIYKQPRLEIQYLNFWKYVSIFPNLDIGSHIVVV